MIRVKLPVSFEDGKAMYDAVLALINKKSPALARMIHSTETYNPFSIQLPDIVNALDIATESIFRDMPNATIERELSHIDLLKTQDCESSIELNLKDVLFRPYSICYPLPDPAKIAISWKNAWNALFSERIPMAIPQIWERPFETNEGKYLSVVHANTRTRSVRIGNFNPFTVFSGNIRIKANGDDEYRRQFNILAKFAEFSGTGSKTQNGCGVTAIRG